MGSWRFALVVRLLRCCVGFLVRFLAPWMASKVEHFLEPSPRLCVNWDGFFLVLYAPSQRPCTCSHGGCFLVWLPLCADPTLPHGLLPHAFSFSFFFFFRCCGVVGVLPRQAVEGVREVRRHRRLRLRRHHKIVFSIEL